MSPPPPDPPSGGPAPSGNPSGNPLVPSGNPLVPSGNPPTPRHHPAATPAAPVVTPNPVQQAVNGAGQTVPLAQNATQAAALAAAQTPQVGFSLRYIKQDLLKDFHGEYRDQKAVARTYRPQGFFGLALAPEFFDLVFAGRTDEAYQKYPDARGLFLEINTDDPFFRTYTVRVHGPSDYQTPGLTNATVQLDYGDKNSANFKSSDPPFLFSAGDPAEKFASTPFAPQWWKGVDDYAATLTYAFNGTWDGNLTPVLPAMRSRIRDVFVQVDRDFTFLSVLPTFAVEPDWNLLNRIELSDLTCKSTFVWSPVDDPATLDRKDGGYVDTTLRAYAVGLGVARAATAGKQAVLDGLGALTVASESITRRAGNVVFGPGLDAGKQGLPWKVRLQNPPPPPPDPAEPTRPDPDRRLALAYTISYRLTYFLKDGSRAWFDDGGRLVTAAASAIATPARPALMQSSSPNLVLPCPFRSRTITVNPRFVDWSKVVVLQVGFSYADPAAKITSQSAVLTFAPTGAAGDPELLPKTASLRIGDESIPFQVAASFQLADGTTITQTSDWPLSNPNLFPRAPVKTITVDPAAIDWTQVSRLTLAISYRDDGQSPAIVETPAELTFTAPAPGSAGKPQTCTLLLGNTPSFHFRATFVLADHTTVVQESDWPVSDPVIYPRAPLATIGFDPRYVDWTQIAGVDVVVSYADTAGSGNHIDRSYQPIAFKPGDGPVTRTLIVGNAGTYRYTARYRALAGGAVTTTDETRYLADATVYLTAPVAPAPPTPTPVNPLGG